MYKRQYLACTGFSIPGLCSLSASPQFCYDIVQESLPVIHRPVSYTHLEEGDIEAVLANCEYIIDQVYHTKANKQAMMETFRTYTYLDTYGRLNVLSSTQVPFHVRRILDRKSTRLNSSHLKLSRMPSSA